MLKFVEDLLQGAPVEWKTLGEVMVRTKGIPITASQMRLLNRSDGAVKVFAGGKTIAYLAYEDLPLQDVHFTPSIIVKSRGIVEFEYYDKAFSHKNELWSYHSTSETVDTKFVYYFLKTKETLLRTKAAIMGAMPQISIPDTENILIPIPPLPVQEKIVEILDKFTELEAKLGTELVLRQKQYEYYRNKLLTFGEEVEWRQLGEIGEIRMCKRIMKNQTSASGEIPFYKIGTFGKEADAYISRELFSEYKSKYNYPRAGDVLISASGTIGRVVLFDGEDAYFQDSNIVWIENEEKKVLNKYLFYCYQIAKWNISEGGTIQRLYNNDLKKTLIPIPYPNDIERSLSEQARIVSILDKFDTLVNSLTEGLPREIALRHKQYEYYRDALLTFPRAT